MWRLLVVDLIDISQDRTKFDAKTRTTAENLSIMLRGKNFMIIFHFVLDVLEVLAYWSKNMQKQAGLLIDYHDFNEKMARFIREPFR